MGFSAQPELASKAYTAGTYLRHGGLALEPNQNELFAPPKCARDELARKLHTAVLRGLGSDKYLRN